MNELQTVFRLNKEIDDYYENQLKVLRSFANDNKMNSKLETLFSTLFFNLNELKQSKDKLLLGDDKV